MNITFSTDNNYLQYYLIAICSVYENNKDEELHFEKGRKIDSRIGIFFLTYLSEFVRKYIMQIKEYNDIIAKMMKIIIEINQIKLISKILCRNIGSVTTNISFEQPPLNNNKYEVVA